MDQSNDQWFDQACNSDNHVLVLRFVIVKYTTTPLKYPCQLTHNITKLMETWKSKHSQTLLKGFNYHGTNKMMRFMRGFQWALQIKRVLFYFTNWKQIWALLSCNGSVSATPYRIFIFPLVSGILCCFSPFLQSYIFTTLLSERAARKMRNKSN